MKGIARVRRIGPNCIVMRIQQDGRQICFEMFVAGPHVVAFAFSHDVVLFEKTLKNQRRLIFLFAERGDSNKLF